ncbi:TPA: RES family NAD+ phosphorylase [Kluyvera cryocrescens]|nr:RES family NAD+ phosphorylase [Kluyvera cryocrescens]
MRLYRLTKTRFAAEAWTGNGARDYGGRWNSEGTPMVYTTGVPSLAVLEVLVHLDAFPGLGGFSLLAIDVPDSLIVQIDPAALPGGWDAPTAPKAAQAIGDNWIREGASVALGVPSAILPIEYNFLLNPKHHAFKAIAAKASVLPFEFDNRLFKSRG